MVWLQLYEGLDLVASISDMATVIRGLRPGGQHQWYGHSYMRA